MALVLRSSFQLVNGISQTIKVLVDMNAGIS